MTQTHTPTEVPPFQGHALKLGARTKIGTSLLFRALCGHTSVLAGFRTRQARDSAHSPELVRVSPPPSKGRCIRPSVGHACWGELTMAPGRHGVSVQLLCPESPRTEWREQRVRPLGGAVPSSELTALQTSVAHGCGSEVPALSVAIN